MKRTERHHLKQNELQRLAVQARGAFEEHRRETTAIVAIAAVVIAAGAVYFLWREHVNSRAQTMLAEALTVQESRIAAPATPGTPGTPGGFPNERIRLQAATVKFKAAADAYPSTNAGIYARYQEAVSQMSLGNASVAAASYQEVAGRAGESSIYGQMAKLGLAEAQARAGQFDQAINAFKELAQRKDGPLPVDGILMQLGRTYRDAGKRADAQQTFNRLVEEFPDSPFAGEAKRELDSLNKT